MRCGVWSAAALVLTCAVGWGEFPGERTQWHGYDHYAFEHDGRACQVVTPKTVAAGRPWIWRARFWGHEPQTDLALLSRGFHVAYMDVAGQFGAPHAVAHWDAFYDLLTTKHGLAERVALEGMSRGGLIAFNWAHEHPERVACIYVDAPVCDIKSWPGGKGIGTGNRDEWQPCLDAYGLTEAEALVFEGNPINKLEPLAKAGVPLLHVFGTADKGVPPTENTAVVEERYKALGGPITLIAKEGIGHHPHSLEDPTPIVDFVLEHTVGEEQYRVLRDGLPNARIRFERDKVGRVVFLGGSITEMTGWRDHMCAFLRERFAQTEFEFVNAGIASTDSTLGPFRLGTDAFAQGPVDLLFVEFAVNDQHNSRGHTERVRGMEGIIRQARTRNPHVDILVQYFVDPAKMDLFNAGQPDPVIVDHEAVCNHYGIPANDLAREIVDRINRGELAWEDFGDAHPKPFGHEIYAASMRRVFDAAWSGPLAAEAKRAPHAMPLAPLDPLNYERARYVGLKTAALGNGWTMVASWDRCGKAGKRKQFVRVPMLEAMEPGAELALDFEGTAVGILVIAGPDVGVLDYWIDDGPPERLDQFTQWSPGLHIPWAYMLSADLDAGAHRLRLRTTDEKHERSKGHAARIVQFLVN